MIKKYFLIISLVFVISLIYSRFMVSVSMIFLIVLAAIQASKSGQNILTQFTKNKAYSGLLLVFFTIILSGFNSDNTSEWVNQVRVKLPFLLLPITFFILRPIDKTSHRWIHFGLIGILLLSSFQVIAGYIMDYEAIREGINKGKSIPTPIDHIHYSVILSYATVSCFVLCIIEQKRHWKIVTLLAGLYLFGFSHFLSVRSGLALCYAGIGIVILWYVITRKKYLIGLSVAGLMAILPFIAYHTVTPFHNKVRYMMWDIEQYQKGKGNNYSDSERLMSFAIAVDLIKDAPLIGHGIGDLRAITTEKHKTKYGEKEKYIYPHNQYLYLATAMGIIGALVFFFGLLCPLIFARDRNIFLVLIFVMLLLSFMVENTIQRAVITAFFLYFILLNLGLDTKEKSPAGTGLSN